MLQTQIPSGPVSIPPSTRAQEILETTESCARVYEIDGGENLIGEESEIVNLKSQHWKVKRKLIRKIHKNEKSGKLISLEKDTSFIKEVRDIFDLEVKFDLPFTTTVVGVHNSTRCSVNNENFNFCLLGSTYTERIFVSNLRDH